MFSEKTIEGAFWYIKELGDVFFYGNVITSRAGKAKLFDKFDGIYVVFLGGLLDIGRKTTSLPCLIATSNAVCTKDIERATALFPMWT